MDERAPGLLIVALGLLTVLVGVAVTFGLLSWFGRLPGDIRLEGENVRVYVPLASMLLVSLLLSVALALARRFF